MNHKVSLNRIIGDVVGNLGISNVNNVVDDFARWSTEALALIGSKNTSEKFECELVIRNKKAPLPPNFLHVLAVKKGSKFLQTTMRSFVQWNKSSKASKNDVNQSAACEHIQDNPGIPRSENILFAGTFVATEVITITITLNDCGNVQNKVYSYIVQPTDTLTDIINYFVTAINNPSIGVVAVVTNGGINVTGLTPEVNFTITPYTDSIAGTVSTMLLQKRVPTQKATNKHESCDVPTKTTSTNLADISVAKLNTGITRQGTGADQYLTDVYGDYLTDDVYKIENGCVWFNTYDDDRIGVSYMGVALDDEGWPLIDEVHERAVTAYLMYMYKGREFYAGKLQNYVFQELKVNWLRLCSQSRGDDELPDRMEMQYLSNMWNQLLPLPNKEYF